MHIGDVVLPDGRRRDLLIEDGRIAAIEPSIAGEPTIDAEGRLLFPGAIDAHVHFREPGDPHKETWATGSRAAAAGGVTTVVDQPNTDPPTVDGATFREKERIAGEAAIVDFGINGGVTPDWQPDELFAEPMTALGEVFMADSTGELGIDAALFEDAVARAADHGVLVTVHAEDADRFDETVRGRDDAAAWSDYRRSEAELVATERAIEVAARHRAEMHLAHASTPAAIDRATAAGWTCEVTPHHLLLSRDDLDELGAFGRMNPPLRTSAEREAVYERVLDGTVTMVATDHAPHTRVEKGTDIWSAPSGVPGVETMLPLLLAEALDGPLTLEAVAELTAAVPAERFALPTKGRLRQGMDADLVLVDPDRRRTVRGDELATACGWTPFEGWTGVFPELTLVGGEVAYHDPNSTLSLPPELAVDRFGEVTGENVRSRGAQS